MEIKLLLERYKNIGFSERRIKEITFAVFEQNSFKLESQDVEIKQTEIKIKVSGTKKTHFVLLKQKIEKELQEALKKEGLLVTKLF
jgi:hypothetical protein